MGPLELLYSWQALLCAVACIGISQFVKTVVDVSIGSRELKSRPSTPPGDNAKAESARIVGKEKRKDGWFIDRFVVPMTPIVVGCVYANLVPLLPDPLMSFIGTHSLEGLGLVLSKAAWGGACGQFSAYIFDRAKETLGRPR